MRKICIIHFQEIEKYPPAINFLRYLNDHAGADTLIEVITTAGTVPSITGLSRIKIRRLTNWQKTHTRIGRMLMYLKFNCLAVLQLMRMRPDSILYFETLSSGPVWFFKTFISKKTLIYVHYHEYVSKTEYANGMALSRWLHKKEKHLYPKTEWVSHTNNDRLSLFMEDVIKQKPRFVHVLPNYPPAAWKRVKCPNTNLNRIGFVYIGALSLETMYLKEMADFVNGRPDKCYWDVYSTNVSTDVLHFFNERKGSNISFKGAIPYDDLPGIFCQYQVGLVLYKGHIPNYVYNVPNKLFEYHVCGLDVWFPKSMASAMPFQTKETYPKIVAVDFTLLESIDVAALTDRSGLHEWRNDFSYENAVKPLAQSMIGEAI